MPVNIEIKARVRDLAAMRRRVEALCETPPCLLVQEDLFFPARHGRLKLRLLDDGSGELIQYRRADAPDARASHYVLYRTAEPTPLRAALEAALGVAGTVRKRRLLFRHAQTRIHLDEVEGLGAFLELEVMLGPEETPEEGRRTAEALMRRLGIEAADLVGEAYIDLIQRAR